MYIIGGNDAGFEWFCPAYSAEQAIGYAKHLYGHKILVRDVREVK
jgi:hypothetical protein